ncbi:glycosyltransferase [Listeria monocytogenes]|nr:glycosyltransferase [Listeria monocytogenes]
MKLITISVPAYNEQESITTLYETIVNVMDSIKDKYTFELLFINDGSKDKTLEIVKQLHKEDNRVGFVDLSRNYGKEIAMAAGFDYAKGDAVITMDADLQHPPELIKEMIELWELGYEDVYARRNKRHGESWLKKATSKWYYKTLQKVTKTPVLPDTGDFRLLDRRCVDALKKLRETQRYTKGLYNWIGFKKVEVTFDAAPRHAGETKWNYRSLINLALEGITSYTTLPLRLSTIAGFAISLGTFIYLIYIVIKTLIVGSDVSGFPTLMITILFLGGIQLISIGIIGEYLGRIFNEVKKRPLYFVEEYNGEKERHSMNKIRKWLDKIPWYTDEIHSILMYLIMGGFTTLINIVTFWLCTYVLNWDYRIANTIAWVASVLFAYFSNKKYVFESYTPTWKERAREVTSFFGFRFLTYLVDILVMILLIEVLSINELWAKIWTNVIVLVLNYVFSKWIIFKVKK